MSRKALRRDLRARRRALSNAQRRAASRRACARAQRLPWFRSSRQVAIYLPMPDEIDPRHLRRNRRSARFYVPVMIGRHDMRFARYRPGLRQTRNRLGIAEPRHAGRRLWRPQAMDLVIMPLLGFDDRCNRLGQGGGHYDRAFSFLAHRRLRHGGTRLVGLAFDCQRIDTLPHEPWDIPLDAVVTESRIYLR